MSNDPDRTPQIGPTLKRLLCSSMYAAINAVSGRARPRKKPTPSSKSRSPDAIPRSRPAASSAPPSRPRPTASSPPRPSRPTGCANAAVIPALSPDPSPPRRSRSSPTNYEEHDSASSLTAFALNSGVYRVPFAMVPSSPIELEEMRNKNQFISSRTMRMLGYPKSKELLMAWIDELADA